MRNRNLLSALLAIVAVFSIPVLTEAQAASLNICCNPVPGSNLIHISFIDPGIYAQFEVTVNAAPMMVLPPAAPSACGPSSSQPRQPHSSRCPTPCPRPVPAWHVPNPGQCFA